MICREKDSRNRRYETSLRPLGYRNLNANSIKTLLSYQPVSVSISVPDCFISFKTGILTESFCKCALKEKDGSPTLEHAVTLVGYKDDSSLPGCSGYWIVKNSWGTEWFGEKGYIKLCIEKDDFKVTTGTCNI